jgi:hypothetical protein
MGRSLFIDDSQIINLPNIDNLYAGLILLQPVFLPCCCYLQKQQESNPECRFDCKEILVFKKLKKDDKKKTEK